MARGLPPPVALALARLLLAVGLSAAAGGQPVDQWLDVRGFGAQTAALVAEGFETVDDLQLLSAGDLLKLGFEPAQATALLAALEHPDKLLQDAASLSGDEQAPAAVEDDGGWSTVLSSYDSAACNIDVVDGGRLTTGRFPTHSTAMCVFPPVEHTDWVCCCRSLSLEEFEATYRRALRPCPCSRHHAPSHAMPPSSLHPSTTTWLLPIPVVKTDAAAAAG